MAGLIILSGSFACLGFRLHRKIINPLTVFNSAWFFVLCLYILGLSNYPTSLTSKGVYAILVMLLCFNVSYSVFLILIAKKFTLKRNITNKSKHFILSKKTLKKAFWVWLSVILIEVIYSGGIPIIWLLMGSSKTYASFGISSVHGCINGLAWVIIMGCVVYLLEVKKNDKAIIKMLSVIIGMYIMLVARQALVTGFIQVIVILIVKNKITTRKLVTSLFFCIVLFGIIGNFRTSAEHFNTVANMSIEIPDFLLGFAWVYMYMITPLGNIDSIVNANINFQYGLASLQSLLPTVISDIVIPNMNYNVTELLVSQAFNVSTFLKEAFIDLGMLGIAILSVFSGVNGMILWNRLTKNPNDIITLMCYAVYINIIALSFFTNMYLSLPIIIQYAYIYLLFKWKIRIK